MALVVSAAAFSEGAVIPEKYSCRGINVSPALSWSGAPDATRSFAIIVDDPDAPAGIFTHWILFNLPEGTLSLPEGASPRGGLPAGSIEGKNDMGSVGYFGPCPPPGKAHRYYFKIYALSDLLALKSGASRTQVDEAMKGLFLAEGRVMATYQRK